MRCVVFAYHEIGFVCLESLLERNATVSLVITHDDDPQETIWFRSVRRLAEEHGIPVEAPAQVNTPGWIARLRAEEPDFLFSFYYRNLLSRDILEIPRYGALNLHGSLLPRYRGRCPVNWVLIHDERQTGVTLHYMEEKPDRGDIVAQRAVPISDTDTAFTLFHKIRDAARGLMTDIYPALATGTAPRLPQDHSRASYFGGRRPEDGRIDWQQPARSIFNLVRAVTHPYPGAFTTWHGRQLFVWKSSESDAQTAVPLKPGQIVCSRPELVVQTGKGLLQLQQVQWEGEAEMAGSAWSAAHGIEQGETLT
jgi:methionyl-tRNA formyltransferase